MKLKLPRRRRMITMNQRMMRKMRMKKKSKQDDV